MYWRMIKVWSSNTISPKYLVSAIDKSCTYKITSFSTLPLYYHNNRNNIVKTKYCCAWLFVCSFVQFLYSSPIIIHLCRKLRPKYRYKIYSIVLWHGNILQWCDLMGIFNGLEFGSVFMSSARADRTYVFWLGIFFLLIVKQIYKLVHQPILNGFLYTTVRSVFICPVVGFDNFVNVSHFGCVYINKTTNASQCAFIIWIEDSVRTEWKKNYKWKLCIMGPI